MHLFRVSVPCPFGRARVSNTHAPVWTSTLDSDTKHLAESTLTRQGRRIMYYLRNYVPTLKKLRYVLISKTDQKQKISTYEEEQLQSANMRRRTVIICTSGVRKLHRVQNTKSTRMAGTFKRGINRK